MGPPVRLHGGVHIVSRSGWLAEDCMPRGDYSLMIGGILILKEQIRNVN